jgi:hypothetical protein
MIAIAILIVVGVIAAASYWLAMRRESAQDRHTARGQSSVAGRKAEAAKKSAARRYAGVEIQVRETACEAAVAMSGQRFLTSEAPALPLAGCTAEHCSCAFVKFSDRRTDDRRLEHSSLSTSLYLANNRRDRTGRREDD